MMNKKSANRQDVDKLLVDITDYVINYKIKNKNAYDTAKYCLMDSIGCAILSLSFPACCKLLGPIVDGAQMSSGTPIPGTAYRLDPVQAAYNMGTMIRWLDYNDTWLAEEWGHPSDNLGAILACADYISRKNIQNNLPPLTIGDVFEYMIKAHEIQGVLALTNSFNKVGLDHVILVRIASTAVSAMILGCTREEIINALSLAWCDGAALRVYRHAPNTGSRKSWAAGDASSRAVWLALQAGKGEMGYPSVLTAKNWGFQDVLFNKNSIKISTQLSSYVMENILFKIAFPAEFHAQTAVEAAITLHEQIKDRLDDIKTIEIETQQAAIRIIDKTGTLDNPADRDHCLQYMVAIALLKGSLSASDYEDEQASDPRIDELRQKMKVSENKNFSKNYLDANKRSIGNCVQVIFNDDSKTQRVEIEYPIGHKRRRKQGIPLLISKFQTNIATGLSAKKCEQLNQLFSSQSVTEKTSIVELMNTLTFPS